MTRRLTLTWRRCAFCGADYFPLIRTNYGHFSTGNRLPRGYRTCPECKSTNTEFMDKLEDCGGCGCMHRIGYTGDCRNDAERF